MNRARERRGDGRRLSAEGKLRRADDAGRSLRKGRDSPNPTVGSAVQHPRRGLEEETVEVVEPHEDGTRTGGGTSVPKENASRSPGVDSGKGQRRKGDL